MHNPPHIGDFIRTEIIKARGLTVTSGAVALGKTRQTLSTLLNARYDFSSSRNGQLSHADIALVCPRLRQFIGCLHPQQRIGFYAECLFKPDCHVSR
jgi:hypothetical protein